ncbi:Dicer-like protein 2, partial [Ascosphaera aggregata]
TQPEFIIKHTSEGYRAKVILTTILRPEFREYEGIESWLTQRMAIRDAAFQACKGLYEAGLLNDRFLPTHKHLMSDLISEPIERRKNLATTSSCQSPWYHVAAAWKATEAYHQVTIEDCSCSGLIPRMLLMLPVRLPCQITFKIYWNEKTTLVLSLTPSAELDKSMVSGAAEATHVILSSVLSQRLEKESRDFS